MDAPDETRVLERIGKRLFTLRVTVVLAPDLDGARVVGLDEKEAYRRLLEMWDGYVPERDSIGDDLSERGPKGDGPGRGEAPRSFQELVRDAKAALERGAGSVTDGARGGGGSSADDDERQLPSKRPRRSDPVQEGVLQRIATLGQILERSTDGGAGEAGGGEPRSREREVPDAVRRVDERLALDRALALGTYPVLLETVIAIDGDVTTRLNEAWLRAEDDPDQRRLEAVLKLQAMGIQTAVSWWCNLIELVGKVGTTLLKLVFPR